MSIGYNYIGEKEDGGWTLPVAIDRVPYSDNKFDFSVIQAESVLDKVPEGDTSIIVGDSAYSCNKFIHNLSKRENVAVITIQNSIYYHWKHLSTIFFFPYNTVIMPYTHSTYRA